MILAVDIGGTKLHAALFEETGPRLEKADETLLATADITSPAEALRAFAGERRARIAACAVGVAGPVLGDRVAGANLPWELSGAALSEALGGVRVALLNDLAASALGLDALGPADLVTLQEGSPDPDGPRALVSPGTGLGEAIVVRGPDGWRPVAGEGGHADFAPRTDEEMELARWLRGRFGRVSAERVISGPGLANVFAWLRDSGRVADDSGLDRADPVPAASITEGALEGGSGICREALRVWSEAFGAEAGNLGLRAIATGGVYLGGGIPGHVLPALRAGGFLRAFGSKAPHEALAARFPVRVVLNPETTLLGAALVAAGRAAA